MKILAFAASSSRQSINKNLITYATTLFKKEIAPKAKVEILDLNDFDMPVYSIDRENKSGIHKLAKKFRAKIDDADAIIISFAMHNGSYTAAYKNVFDWASRIEGKVYEGKPVILLAASPGPQGAPGMIALAQGAMPYFGATIVGSLAVPTYQNVFDEKSMQLTDNSLKNDLSQILSLLPAAID